MKLPHIYVAIWSKLHIPSTQFCECLNEWVALLMKVNPGKHKKWCGIAYKGKVGDTFKCLQGCPADFAVKTCGFVPRVESQMQCSGFKYHEKNKLVSLQSDIDSTKNLWSCWKDFCWLQWRWLTPHLEKLVILILFLDFKKCIYIKSVNIKPRHCTKKDMIALLFPVSFCSLPSVEFEWNPLKFYL